MPKIAEPSVVEVDVEEKEEAGLKAYEVMLLWNPTLLEGKLKEKFKEFEEFVAHGGGKMVTSDIWGKQKLAYRIKSNQEGVYAVYDLELLTSFIKELNEHLRIDPELLRYIIVTLPPHYTYTKYVEEKMEEERPRRERTAKSMSYKYKASIEERPEAQGAPLQEEKAKAPEEKTPPKEVDEAALEKKLDELLGGEDLKL